ncbi:MAG TPA: hypothetical protein VNO75_01060 [Gemmatimonadaceae bacterium]|nr:hypothetical protein [Gemmatimonadaceae bacterium]
MKLGLAALLLIGGTAACASTPRSEAADIMERTTVTVDNQSFSDMTIYATRGQRIRLGIATGHTKTVFTLPPSLVGGAGLIRFVADPVGSSRTAVSEEITVRPGDQVGLTIPPG